MSFGKVEKYTKIKQSTLSTWVIEINGEKCVKLPSGKCFRVIEIDGIDGNTHSVIEACDWMALAADLIKNRGKATKATTPLIVAFVAWFAVDRK